jgi:hypothetical protein
MFDPQHQLLSRHLAALAAELAADPAPPDGWSRVEQASAPALAGEPELAAVLAARDAAGLKKLADEWTSGARMLPEPDRALLKRALAALKKKIKITRLDEESRIGGGAMSSGRRSTVVAVAPPREFGSEVWDELVRQKRLRGSRGVYEIPPQAPGGEG